jgi:hypothetical protein
MNRKGHKMKTKRFIECVVPLAVCLIIGLSASNPAWAWGPFSHGVIAGEASETRGMPAAATGLDFMHQASTPKVLEYTNLGYAQRSYDFSQYLSDLARTQADETQALAWGSYQTAERAGDIELFHQISQSAYQRWLDEILCDALLFSWVDSPWTRHVDDVAVAVRPKLVSDASKVYTTRFGGMPFSGLDALARAHFQAVVMVGELAVIRNPLVQEKAVSAIDLNQWRQAMAQSVDNVTAYAISGSRSRADDNWFVGDADDYGTRLLGKLGSILLATGDVSISVSRNNDGVWTYRFLVTSDQVNDVTVSFLRDISRRLDEDPIMRHLAQRLYDMMTARRID